MLIIPPCPSLSPFFLSSTPSWFQEQLDVALSKTCKHFDVSHYTKVQLAYTLLGKTQVSGLTCLRGLGGEGGLNMSVCDGPFGALTSCDIFLAVSFTVFQVYIPSFSSFQGLLLLWEHEHFHSVEWIQGLLIGGENTSGFVAFMPSFVIKLWLLLISWHPNTARNCNAY